MSPRPSTIAVLPVKRLDQSKTRLAEGGLTPGTRRALVEAMVTDVLVALRRSQRVDQTIVVTGEPALEAIAHGYDADSVVDPDDASHSSAAIIGVRAARERGAKRVLLVPGDCPALDPKEVDALLARPLDGPDVVIVSDRHGTGTNALLLTPPDILEPSFGPASLERHLAAAQAAGARCEVLDIPSLVLDVDTRDDLEVLRTALEGKHGGAAHTRGLLNRLGRK